MCKNIFLTLFLLALISLPILSFAKVSFTMQNPQSIIDQLQKQVENLELQLAILKVKGTDPSTGLNFTKTLSRGMVGGDVRILQQFLGQSADIYPKKLVTGYFGPLTEAAIKMVQVKNGLVATGFVDLNTIKVLNNLYGKTGSQNETSSPTVVGGQGIDSTGNVSITLTSTSTSTPVSYSSSTDSQQVATTTIGGGGVSESGGGTSTSTSTSTEPVNLPNNDFIISVSRTVSSETYSATSPNIISVTVTMSGAGPKRVNALGFREIIPAGWTFVEQTSNGPFVIFKQTGNVLEYASLQTFMESNFPQSFSYNIMPSANSAGIQEISGQALYRTMGGELRSNMAVTRTLGQ